MSSKPVGKMHLSLCWRNEIGNIHHMPLDGLDVVNLSRIHLDLTGNSHHIMNDNEQYH